jgi:hypothetical protein
LQTRLIGETCTVVGMWAYITSERFIVFHTEITTLSLFVICRHVTRSHVRRQRFENILDTTQGPSPSEPDNVYSSMHSLRVFGRNPWSVAPLVTVLLNHTLHPLVPIGSLTKTIDSRLKTSAKMFVCNQLSQNKYSSPCYLMFESYLIKFRTILR